MKILGIDTSTKFFSIGIYNQGKFCEYNLELGRNLSLLITLSLKRILESLSWEPEDIDYFACGLGPGSFTGLRVGLATIKGLAWARNKPIIGISTLDILAKNIKPQDAFLVPMIDAKRSLVYCSIYKNKSGSLKRLAPYSLLSPELLLKKIKPKSIILGDASSLYREAIVRKIKGAKILDSDYWYPKGRNIISLALEKIEDAKKKKIKLNNAFDIQPIYLYPKECQIK